MPGTLRPNGDPRNDRTVLARPDTVFYPTIDGVADSSRILVNAKGGGEPPDRSGTASLDEMARMMRVSGYTPNVGDDKAEVVPTLRTPYLTSDFFLEDKADKDKKVSVTQPTTTEAVTPFELDRILQCSQPKTDGAVQALMAGVWPALGIKSDKFTPDEIAEIRWALQDETRKLSEFKTQYCEGGQASLKTCDQCTAAYVDAVKRCDVSTMHELWQKERDKLISAYDDARGAADQAHADQAGRCRAAGAGRCSDAELKSSITRLIYQVCGGVAGADNPILNFNPLGRIQVIGCKGGQSTVNAQVEKVKAYYAARAASTAADRKAEAALQASDQFITGGQFPRQYENVSLRFARILDLIKSAVSGSKKDEVLDFLKLKRCEAGDFAQPVKTNWSDFSKQVHATP